MMLDFDYLDENDTKNILKKKMLKIDFFVFIQKSEFLIFMPEKLEKQK
jgi:hypothetical protein